MQRPVVSNVSHATRPDGSSARIESRTASEIWSAILSGWPSVTDSEVKVQRLTAFAPGRLVGRVSSSAGAEGDDGIEHRRGHDPFFSQADILRERLAEHHDLVRVVLEARAGRGDVVRDDEVEVLAAELRLRVLAKRFGLG